MFHKRTGQKAKEEEKIKPTIFISMNDASYDLSENIAPKKEKKGKANKAAFQKSASPTRIQANICIWIAIKSAVNTPAEDATKAEPRSHRIRRNQMIAILKLIETGHEGPIFAKRTARNDSL